MKKFTLLLFILCIFSTANAAKITSAFAENNAVVENNYQKLSPQQMQMMSTLSVKEIEQLTGKKLSLKEKISWMLLKKQLKKTKGDAIDEKQNSRVTLGFVFSILGLLVFPLFAVPAFILVNNALKAEKENPGTLTRSNVRLAKTTKIICLVDAVILVAVIALVILIVGLGNWH